MAKTLHGGAWRLIWLRHCYTSRIPDWVIEIFYLLNPSGRNQPVTEMSTRNISSVGLKILPLSFASYLEILGASTL